MQENMLNKKAVLQLTKRKDYSNCDIMAKRILTTWLSQLHNICKCGIDGVIFELADHQPFDPYGNSLNQRKEAVAYFLFQL